MSALSRGRLKLLNHHDAVTFNSILQRLGGMELLRSGLLVAIAAIDRRKLGAQIEHSDLDLPATLKAQMLFRRCHQADGQPLALMGRIDSQLAQITSFTPRFGVNAAQKLAVSVFSRKNGTLAHHCRHTLVVGARTREEGFNGEGCIDDGNQARPVSGGGGADLKSRV